MDPVTVRDALHALGGDEDAGAAAVRAGGAGVPDDGPHPIIVLDLDSPMAPEADTVQDTAAEDDDEDDSPTEGDSTL